MMYGSPLTVYSATRCLSPSRTTRKTRTRSLPDYQREAVDSAYHIVQQIGILVLQTLLYRYAIDIIGDFTDENNRIAVNNICNSKICCDRPKIRSAISAPASAEMDSQAQLTYEDC